MLEKLRAVEGNRLGQAGADAAHVASEGITVVCRRCDGFVRRQWRANRRG